MHTDGVWISENIVSLDYEGEGCWTVNIYFAVWRGRGREYYIWCSVCLLFSIFACAVQQSERSSELALRKEVMSIQRGCFRQVVALIRTW